MPLVNPFRTGARAFIVTVMLSVIIPTLNEAALLERTLKSLARARAQSLVGEIIIVDGGSDDGTREIAKRFGARLFYSRRGRGAQLRRGGNRATGTWLLFLHADTVLVPAWAEAASRFMTDQNEGKAAAFKFALDDTTIWARMVEWGVALRWRWLKLPYGDQGLLISRDFYREIGGFRPMALMEDVEIIHRIGKRRIELLPARAITSARRYKRGGYILRLLRNGMILALYALGVRPRVLARLYG